VIDAKDPRRGALGAVTRLVFGEIRRAVTQPTSAALGDALDAVAIEQDAAAFRAAGATFVKIESAGLDAALRGAPGCVVAVAYADADRVGSATPYAVLDAAARSGAAGILLDTADKSGPALHELFTAAALTAWVHAAHSAGLRAAVAGRLRPCDLAMVRDAGTDIAGVRTAACDGGRTGRVSIERVRLLRADCD
jgi:uncharacterized protein (UPF0264 family)